MQDIIMWLNVKFTEEEKRHAVSTAYRVIDLANIAKHDGILALEQECVLCDNFMKIGIELILNGTSPDIVENTFKHLLLSSQSKGLQLLERLIIAEGLIVMSKDNYSIADVSASVGALLGEDYVLELLKACVENKIDADCFISEYTEPLLESAEFEQCLMQLSKLELSYVLTFLNPIEIATAIKGCNQSFALHMRNGLREDIFLLVCRLLKVIESLVQKDAILDAQQMIINQVNHLKTSGVFNEKYD